MKARLGHAIATVRENDAALCPMPPRQSSRVAAPEQAHFTRPDPYSAARSAYLPNSGRLTISFSVTNSISASTKAIPVRNAHS